MSAPAPAPPPAVVVDTDVVSFLFKGDTRAAFYQPHLAGAYPVISFMTLAELACWAEERNWGPQTRANLAQFLTGFAVHYPDENLCGLCGVVMAAARKAGRRIQSGDAWIATTALYYGVSLLTHNARDFAGVPGLTIHSAPAP